LLAYENGLNVTENSAVPAQTPPSGVSAGTALFSLATVVAYGGVGAVTPRRRRLKGSGRATVKKE